MRPITGTLDAGIASALAWTDVEQHADGYWVGVLESNACMEAEWLLAFHILGYDCPWAGELVTGILNRQRPDGAWETYYEAPAGDINATVESYAALRASGMAADSEPLQRARAWIFAHGGLRKTRVFTRIWLAMIGEWPWHELPSLLPEIIRLPLWMPFNIYNFASWARATIVPLTLLTARTHARPLPHDNRLDELFPQGRERYDYAMIRRGARFSRSGLFYYADRLVKRCFGSWRLPGRDRAVQRCIDWIVAHQDTDGSWGGIQPPWIYSLIALHAEGRGLDDPVIARGLAALETHWSCHRYGGRMIQACESPVWDTVLMIMAMLDCGQTHGEQPILQTAVDWLLDQEIRTRGDWSVKLPNVEPGGWAFEHANSWYPDIDDTGVVLAVLARLRDDYPDRHRLDAVLDRTTRWLEAMQSRNGGWGAFDKDNDSRLLADVPFSDFGEAVDPPSVDVTAHVLEGLGELGRDRSDPVVRRGLAYIQSEQEASGSWFGRWGVNHIYGTAAVLTALRALGEPMDASYVVRAGNWLAEQQNEDGGWGESCASYMDSARIGSGVSTASQTGWAMMGLLVFDDGSYASTLERGATYLLNNQVDGTWHEPEYTGTGFPGYGIGARTMLDAPALADRLQQGGELQRGFMINYNLYRHYFPLAALGRMRARQAAPTAVP
jgi:squalene-hopene/tetraprenyl-beta-curcumene cyclase